MSAYKTQQHRLVHRGQTFHLVSYAGQPADENRHQPEVPASWYLMLSGKRWMVSPQLVEATPDELERGFRDWLDVHVFGDASEALSRRPPAAEGARLAGPPEGRPTAIPPAGPASR